MTGLIYLASPYSHESAEVRQDRCWRAAAAAARLMARGYTVFSPVAHSHVVAHYGPLDPMDREFWQRQHAPLLAAASEVWVLLLDGWRDSIGVRAEVIAAARAGKPVRALYPDRLTTGPQPDELCEWMLRGSQARETPVTEQSSAALGEYPGLPPMDREDVTGLRRSGYLMERAQRERTAYAAVLRIAVSAPEGTPWMAAMEVARRLDELTRALRQGRTL